MIVTSVPVNELKECVQTFNAEPVVIGDVTYPPNNLFMESYEWERLPNGHHDLKVFCVVRKKKELDFSVPSRTTGTVYKTKVWPQLTYQLRGRR